MTSPARARGRTLAYTVAGALLLTGAVVGYSHWETAQARDALTAMRATTAPVTTSASLGARPEPQIRFVDAVGTEYRSLLVDGWERVLDAAEETCRDRKAGAGEPMVADGAARRFAVPGRPLDMTDGMRLVRLLDDLRVCASFGLA